MRTKVIIMIVVMSLSCAIYANNSIEASSNKDSNSTLIVTSRINGLQDIALIRDNTEETAKNTDNKKYNTCAIIISSIALILSILTLIYTIRTYKSQKKTEKNTVHMTPEVQKKFLLGIVRYLYLNIVKTKAFAIIQYNRKGIVKDWVSELQVDAGGLLHEEIYYNDSEKYSKISNCSNLIYI